MKTLLLVWSLLVGVFLGPSASGYVLVSGTNTTLAGQPWWNVAYQRVHYKDGAGFLRIGAATNTITGSIPISGGPGTYRIWIDVQETGSGVGGIGFTLGDGTGGMRATNNLSFVPSFTNITTTIAFTNLVLTLTNATSPSASWDWYVHAVCVTSNLTEALTDLDTVANSKWYMVDYGTSTETNEVDIVKGNLLPNSSFEFGFANGWSYSRTPGTSPYKTWLDEGIDTTVARSGVASVKISDTAARFQVHLPTFRLRGPAVWRPYTFSFWAKGNGPTVSASISSVIPSSGNSGFVAPATKTFTFGVPGTNWVRYSTNFYLYPSPTREFYGWIQHVSTGSSAVWIDDVQIEEGGLTDWAPRMGVGMSTYTRLRSGLYFQGETPELSVVLFNSGTNSQFVTVRSEVYDIDNRVVTNLVGYYTVPPGDSTNACALPSSVGAYRVVSQIDASGYDVAECNYLVAPYSAATVPATLVTNHRFGTHLVADNALAATNRLLHGMWSRVFSTAQLKWSTVETNDGAWDFAYIDGILSQLRTNSIMMAAIGDIKAVTNGSTKNTPTWAVTNNGASNLIDLVRFERHVSNLVKYCYPTVRYWEAPNEPMTLWSPERSAAILQAFIAGVSNGNPNAIVIAGSGIDSVTYASNMWALIPAGQKAWVSKFSVHLYPETKGMGEEDEPMHRELMAWGLTNSLEIWNTESGAWKYAHRHQYGGWLSGGSYLYPMYWEEVYTRSHWQSSEQLIRTVLRSLGVGHARYFQYDSRVDGANVWARINTEPRLWEFDDVLSPDALAYATAAWILGTSTSLGQLTNSTTQTNLEAYLWLGSAGDAVITAWTRHRSNAYTVTLTNSGFGVVDMFGRPVQTNNASVWLSRKPVYLRSTVLGTNALKGAFTGASALLALSQTAPYASIDVSPRGYVTNQHLPLTFKWVALGQIWINNQIETGESVLTRQKVEGLDSDYDTWSAERLRVISTLPANGLYRLVVQAKDLDSVATNTVYGPYFRVGPEPRPAMTASNATVNNMVIQ